MLFINKNARSDKLSSSHGSERASIYSHVQRGPHDQTRAKSSDMTDLSDLLPNSSISDSVGDELECVTIPRQKRTSRPKTRDAKVKVQTNDAQDSLRALQLSSQPQQRICLTEPSRGLGLGGPFDPSHATMKPYVEALLRFYSSDARPRLFPIQKLSDSSRFYTLTRALEEPLQRNTILCVTSAAIYANTGDACHGIATMTFKARAFSSLQRQLLTVPRNKAITFCTIHAVALLLYVECLVGNNEDLAAHIAGLRHFLNETDLQLFDAPHSILVTLFSSIYLGAAILDVAPDLKPFEVVDSSQISPAAQMALENISTGPSSMARRLFTEHTDFLSPVLFDAAMKQRTVMHFRYICSVGNHDPSPGDLHYIHSQEMAIEHQLTALRADKSLTPAQHALRLALFIFHQPSILLAKPNTALCKAMTRHLKKWLDKSDLFNLWAPRSDLLLWIFFVAAHISIGEAEWPWVRSFLSTLITAMDVQSFDEMEAVLKGFYYYPRYFRATVQRIWAEYELGLGDGQTRYG